MAHKYTVPQFIDVEDKIFGPITTRQFLILLVTAGLMFVAYKLFDFGLFLIVAILEFAVGGTFAFFKVNGQPFHFFMLNVIQTTRKPKLRLWNKEIPDDQLRQIIKAPPPPPPKKKIIKTPLAETKLAELTLIVNTGGVYNPED